jgi:hypothetical protein
MQAGTRERSKPEIITGVVIGEYRVGPLVAFGRHARLFAAEDAQGRAAILKVLRPAVREHHAFRELMVRERKLISSLEHPNIERFRGRGDVAGEPYYAVEMIAGVSLEEVAEEVAFDPWDLANAVELGRALFGALEHAHARGIEHGAIGEDVVRISPAGRIVLTRFGLPPLRCSSRRKDCDRTHFEPQPLEINPKDRFANDVADAAQIVSARLRSSHPPRVLRAILREACAASPLDRPSAQEVADVFRGFNAAPIPVGFGNGGTAWDVTEKLRNPRGSVPPQTVTLLMTSPDAPALAPASVGPTTLIQPETSGRLRPLAIGALFAAFALGTLVANTWVAGG